MKSQGAAVEDAFINALDASDKYLTQHAQLQSLLKEASYWKFSKSPHFLAVQLAQYLTSHRPETQCALQAFFCLAKARYAMGSHRVGVSQFDAHMTATSLIAINPESEGSQYSVLRLKECKATSFCPPADEMTHPKIGTVFSQAARSPEDLLCDLFILDLFMLSDDWSLPCLQKKARSTAALYRTWSINLCLTATAAGTAQHAPSASLCAHRCK